MTHENRSAWRSGPALVRVGSDSFQADRCTYDGRGVTFHGRVRIVKYRDGVELEVSLGDLVERTVPIARVASIDWQPKELRA